MSNINLCKQLQLTGSNWMGLMISGAIAIIWLISLLWSLSCHLINYSPIVLALWLLLRTFLHTGLFAITHDAMHGNVLPKYPVQNHWIGQLSLGLYGFLPYQVCRKLHWQHHSHPAQAKDPDFYPKAGSNLIWYFVRWYFSFMESYLTPRNLALVIAGIGITTLSLVALFQVAIQNIVLFWILPWVLSSIQLFAFGIFLPHYSDDTSTGSHRPRSYYYPIICSLLICYHFSYHWEHHAYPDVPWYQLPYVQPLSN